VSGARIDRPRRTRREWGLNGRRTGEISHHPLDDAVGSSRSCQQSYFLRVLSDYDLIRHLFKRNPVNNHSLPSIGLHYSGQVTATRGQTVTDRRPSANVRPRRRRTLLVFGGISFLFNLWWYGGVSCRFPCSAKTALIPIRRSWKRSTTVVSGASPSHSSGLRASASLTSSLVRRLIHFPGSCFPGARGGRVPTFVCVASDNMLADELPIRNNSVSRNHRDCDHERVSLHVHKLHADASVGDPHVPQ